MSNILPANFVSTINASMGDSLASLSTYTLVVLGVVALATIIYVIINALKGH
jgi:hypothetical protein